MSERIQVINLGTAEEPNFGGSAYEMGRLHGVLDALAALKALGPRGEYAYDAVKNILPKGVEW